MGTYRGNSFASGNRSLAECPRCGLPCWYKDLRLDGQRKDWVCRDCWDPKHPQELVPKDIYDPEALQHPRMDNTQNNEAITLWPPMMPTPVGPYVPGEGGDLNAAGLMSHAFRIVRT